MSVFSRGLRTGSPVRTAVAVLALSWLVVLAAFVYASVSLRPTIASIVAAAAAWAIAGAGILYAWREPGHASR